MEALTINVGLLAAKAVRRGNRGPEGSEPLQHPNIASWPFAQVLTPERSRVKCRNERWSLVGVWPVHALIFSPLPTFVLASSVPIPFLAPPAALLPSLPLSPGSFLSTTTRN